jgi:hypothetical protein
MNRRLPRQPGIKTDSHDLNLAYVKVWRKRLRDGANAALKLKNVPKDERRDLEWALNALPSLDTFVKIIRTLPSRRVQVDALRCLSAVVGISFVIGSRASLSETQRVYQQSTAQSARGKTPRQRTPKQKRMDELIAQCCRLKPNATDGARAQYVLEHWGDALPMPNQRTVERDLTKLK